MKKFVFVQFMLFLLWSNPIFAGAGNWSNVNVFNQAPLEVKLGTFTDDPNSDLLTMVLWNDGSMNRLDAVIVPFPFDGTNVTSMAIENTATLFSLGDICRIDNNIVVPYIKNFNVEVAWYNGSMWSNMTIPETIGNNFDSADCAVSQDAVFVSGHDLDDSEIELFKVNPSFSGFTFYGKYGGGGTATTDVAGPFDGGVRDTLVMQRDGPFSMSLYQSKSGMIGTVQFDSSDMTPTFIHNDIEQEFIPAGFTFVKESYGVHLPGLAIFGYNAESRAKAIEISDTNSTPPQIFDLGAINNVGSQFTFQGGAYFSSSDGLSNGAGNNILWDEYTGFNSLTMQIDIDANYPLKGVGGPVTSCRREPNRFTSEIYIAGPKVGSAGTDLYIKELESFDAIFADGFESGDTSKWSSSCH